MRIIVEEKSGMNLRKFGGIEIFRPKVSSEIAMRYEAQKHLFSKFQSGKYTDPETINQIIQHQFSFYFEKLTKYIEIIAQKDFLHFLLFQYDKSSEIDSLYKARELNKDEERKWLKTGSIFRRTIKYLSERSTLLNGEKEHTHKTRPSLEGLDNLWICAEESVGLYLLSDQSYTIFPESTSLEILNREIGDYFMLTLAEEYDLNEYIRVDTEFRDRFVGKPADSILLNTFEHQLALGDAFSTTVGLNYLETIGVIYKIIEGCVPSNEGFPVLFVHKQNVIDALVKETGASSTVIEKAISGFLITKANMETEGREVWKAKQEYRAYRRGFFEVWHPTGPHICFSKSMAIEALLQLISEVVFKKIPPEWSSAETSKAADALSNKAGNWFEEIAFQNLKTLGFIGLKSQRRVIGQGTHRIEIPPEVGEIDYIGYSSIEKMLVLIECKLVRGVSEPKFFRDDISDFITKPKSYLNKFNKKVQWIKDNQQAVCEALESCKDITEKVEVKQFNTAIITHYPTIAQCLIKEHPCVSITNFMLDYEKKNAWPY